MQNFPHGNSHENFNEHHLYGIFERETESVFKFGVTDDPIGSDGLPARTRKQVRFANLAAGFLKFFGKILMSGIAGRALAEQIERERVREHEEKHGQKPPGNLK